VSSRLEALELEHEKAARKSKEERLRRQVTEAELRALRAQVNPHFLFNSLNTVADLIVTDPAKAEVMIVQLAKVFRHLLSRSDKQMTTVSEEIEFLRTYLGIEAVRFGDRMRFDFSVDDGTLNESVPSLILQPVVENALKHGLSRKIGTGLLQVSVRTDNGFLRLEVEDDGVGFEPEALSSDSPFHVGRLTEEPVPMRGGVGLQNVRERLSTIYSGSARVLIETRMGGGSRVTLMVPRVHEAER
jgi:two-component system LytT family sensor kinase